MNITINAQILTFILTIVNYIKILIILYNFNKYSTIYIELYEIYKNIPIFKYKSINLVDFDKY